MTPAATAVALFLVGPIPAIPPAVTLPPRIQTLSIAAPVLARQTPVLFVAALFIRTVAAVAPAVTFLPQVETLSASAAELAEGTSAVSAAATAMTLLFIRVVRAVYDAVAALRAVDAGAVSALEVHPFVTRRAVDLVGSVEAVAVAVAEATAVDALAAGACEVDGLVAGVTAGAAAAAAAAAATRTTLLVRTVQTVGETVAAQLALDALAVDALEVVGGWAAALPLHRTFRANQTLGFINGCVIGSSGDRRGVCSGRCCCRCRCRCLCRFWLFKRVVKRVVVWVVFIISQSPEAEDARLLGLGGDLLQLCFEVSFEQRVLFSLLLAGDGSSRRGTEEHQQRQEGDGARPHGGCRKWTVCSSSHHTLSVTADTDHQWPTDRAVLCGSSRRLRLAQMAPGLRRRFGQQTELRSNTQSAMVCVSAGPDRRTTRETPGRPPPPLFPTPPTRRSRSASGLCHRCDAPASV